MSYIQAVNEALTRELETRPEVFVYGEDVGHAGGIFGASRNLLKTYGIERVFDTPISESAILGSAVGAALMGMKPIVEIMWADFLLVALDQLINQAANIRYVTAGRSPFRLSFAHSRAQRPAPAPSIRKALKPCSHISRD